jgi:hypothetical protein
LNFANYEAFRVAFQKMFEGDDAASNTFSTHTMDTIIGLGEARVYHGDNITPGLRASTMVRSLSQAVTSNAASLPADLLELKEVYFSGERPLEILPLDRLRHMESLGGSGDARFCAQDGDTLRFYPTASGTALGRYYARPAALESVTWGDATTFARYPEVFLYAALYEGAVFLGMTDKMGMWEAKYRQLAEGANHSERMRVWSGGPLRVRAR